MTGERVTVAVLDSGVDYKGSGGRARCRRLRAFGTKTKNPKNQKIDDAYRGAKLFPTAKVIGGYDFVGEAWVGGADSPPLAPDPDPMFADGPVVKDGCAGGHGTHVDGHHRRGARRRPRRHAPRRQGLLVHLHVVQWRRAAPGHGLPVDPNGDGVPSDKADIINLSLGSIYGQATDDDLSPRSRPASAAGILTAAAAGNCSDKPYCTDSPGSAPSAVSVAQTSVPSATGFAMSIDAPAAMHGQLRAVWQPWSAELDGVDGDPVRRRFRRQPARLRSVRSRVPGRQDRLRRPWLLQLHPEDLEHRRRRRRLGDHRDGRAG